MSFDSVNQAEVVADLEGQQPQEVAQTPEVTPQQAAPVTPPAEEALYEVKINGQTHRVPLSELTSGYSRQRDYTQKTTEIAEYRRQIDAEVAQYRQQIQEARQYLSQPHIRQAILAAQQQGQVDPNAQLTAAQAQQLLEQRLQQQEQVNQQQMQQMAYELQVQQLAAGYDREIVATIDALKQRHPVLQDIEGFDQILRQKVGERQPQTLEEAKQAFIEIGQAAAAKVEARFATQQKQAAVQAAQLKRTGIEPPGGAVAPLPQTGQRLKIGSADMFAAAVSDMLGNTQ